MELKIKLSRQGFKASPSGDEILIEGFANKAVVDDVGDLMTFDNIDMRRFEKNPIMFFNHDRNMPIGKWIDWKVTDDGLMVKGMLSKSDNATIKMVRDLVNEGIIKTLSIGYEEQQSKRNSEGVNIVERWRLNEVSVVTLPANIEAEFDIAKMKTLNGEIKSAQTIEQIKALIKAEPPASEENEDSPDEPPADNANTEQPPADNTEGAKPCGDEDKPKTDGDTSEPAAKPDSEPGNDSGGNNEPASKPEGEGEPAAKAEGDSAFQDCVSRLVPQLVADGKTQEQAVAIAMEQCREGKCAVGKGVEFVGDTPPITTPIDPTDIGNPHLDVAKGMLAMLGTINSTLQLILQKLDTTTTVAPEPQTGNNESVPTEGQRSQDENVIASLSEIKSISDRLNKRFKDLGF